MPSFSSHVPNGCMPSTVLPIRYLFCLWLWWVLPWINYMPLRGNHLMQGTHGKSISTHGTHISVFNFLILWWFYAILFCLSYDVDEACHNPRFFEQHLHLNQKSDWSLRKEWIGRLCRGGWWTLRHLLAALVRNYSIHIIPSPVLSK